MNKSFDIFFRELLQAVKTAAADAFDQNIENKSFFGDKWKEVKHPVKRGSLMMRTGAPRRGNKAIVTGSSISFYNSQPHAALHNEGGSITVTAAMKKFFWAKYYQAAGKVKQKKTGGITKASEQHNADADYWKSMALMKVGAKLTIPQRRWIGHHPKVDELIKQQVDKTIKTMEKDIANSLKQRS